MSFKPRAGSKAEKVVNWFQQNPTLKLTGPELAAQFDIEPKNINGSLKNAIVGGAIVANRDGRHMVYALGNGESLPAAERPAHADAPTVEAAAPGITIALYNDGELFLGGTQAVDGGVLLSSAQAVELREYLLHTGSFIEHLQAVQS